MRRFAIGLAILLALSLMLAAVAVAAPSFCDPNNPRYDPDNTLCSPTTTDGTTTATTTVPTDLDPCSIDTFSVESDPGWTRFGCNWILPVDAPSSIKNGVITVDLVSGKISTLSVMVHDSSPGDICELNWLGKTLQDSEWYEGPLPADGLELTVSLEELESDDWSYDWEPRGTYWDFDYLDNDGVLQRSTGAHWCGPYDPIEGLRTDLNGDPLRLYLTMRATKGTVVEVTLTPVRVQE